jgi:hypothetical protein
VQLKIQGKKKVEYCNLTNFLSKSETLKTCKSFFAVPDIGAKNIVETAVGVGSFKTLVKALEAADVLKLNGREVKRLEGGVFRVRTGAASNMTPPPSSRPT